MGEASVNGTSVASQQIEHYVFNNEAEVWRRRAPPAHAAKKVQIELDRLSYVNRTRTKEMRSSIMAWAFPDTSAQVTLINPAMVVAMGGANLITPKSLQIKDAGNHLMDTEGAVFIVVTRKDNITRLKRRTFQMAYVSPRAEDIVLSREAMETLGLVSNLDNRREASVCHISTTPADGGGTSSTPADGGGTGSHISCQI